MSFELTTTSISSAPVLLLGKGREKRGEELSLGIRERWGECALRFGFVSRYPTLA